MNDEKRKPGGRHEIIIENRERASVTGVTDIISFDEESVIAETDGGVLILRGNGLHMEKLNLDEGHLIVDGDIFSAEYSEPGFAKGRGSLFAKIFK